MVRLSVKVKEKIAEAIGSQFTTNEIVNVFSDAGVSTNRELFAKAKIILDAFTKITDEDLFFRIINEFCHPLRFQDENERTAFIKEIGDTLSYDNIDATWKDNKLVFIINGQTNILYEPNSETYKTSTDYIVEVLNFFKDEYNKVRLSGLTYDYSLGENASSDQTDGYGKEGYEDKLRAIIALKDAGVITWYKIEPRVKNEGYYVWDYAVCKIDESKLMQKEAPKATDAGVQAITKKIIHEHTHHFDNSIQEKEINLNLKNEIFTGSKENPKSPNKIQLKSTNISYDDDKPALKIGEQTVAIPAYKNEHYFCRAMYEYKKDEAVDWTVVWEKMTGYDTHPDKQ